MKKKEKRKKERRKKKEKKKKISQKKKEEKKEKHSLLDDQHTEISLGARLSAEECSESHFGDDQGCLLTIGGLGEEGCHLASKEAKIRANVGVLGECLVELCKEEHDLLEELLGTNVSALLHIRGGNLGGRRPHNVTKVLVDPELLWLKASRLLLERLRERGGEFGGGEKGHVIVRLTSPLAVLLPDGVGLGEFLVNVPLGCESGKKRKKKKERKKSINQSINRCKFPKTKA
jgi:hypothetical protein